MIYSLLDQICALSFLASCILPDLVKWGFANPKPKSAEFRIPLRDLRRVRALAGSFRDKNPLQWKMKQLHEFSGMIVDTEKDLMRPLKSLLNRNAQKLSVRQIKRIAELMDHLALHTSVMRDIVEEGRKAN